LVLRHHPTALAAVILTSAFVGLAASSAPLVRAAVESESLKGQVRTMSPLAAGLEIQSGGPIGLDGARRRGAVALAAQLSFVGSPVLTTMFPAQIAGADGSGVQVVAMARTGAAAHVGHVTHGAGHGVWISRATAKVTRLRPGGTLRLTGSLFPGAPSAPVMRLRVAGVYDDLDGDLQNPYWANFLQDIRSPNSDAPPLPAFVLMPERTLVRLARSLAPYVQNRFEFPVAPRHVSSVGARRLQRRFATIRRELAGPLGRPLGCASRAFGHRVHCVVTSSLGAALLVAAHDVAAVAPTISLLSGCGIGIALATVFAAGIFLTRRRADEAQLLFARGESTVSFGARSGVEAVAPTVAGSAAGFGLALLALRSFAPAGSVDGGTVSAALGRAGAGAVVALLVIAAGAALAYPRRSDHAGSRARWLRGLPWEVVPLAAAAGLLADVLAGGGLAHDSNGANHPRLVVFLLPVIAVAAVAGLVARAARPLLRRRATGAPPAVFLAVRRLGAAGALLVTVVVGVAVAFGAFAYASVLSASLHRSAAEKAFVSNGSDVQGFVDPSERITDPLPFPAALVQVDSLDVSLSSGERVDLLAGDPAALARTIRWGAGWGDDPRTQLPRLEDAHGPGLAAIATRGTPAADAIVDQGVRIPVTVVGRSPFPGTTAGRSALVVSASALRRVARRVGILDPGPGAEGLLWARGDPRWIEPALLRSNLGADYLTTVDHVLEDASVLAAERSYGYVRAIAAAAAGLALLALLLYLQARQRVQLIASALTRRMGLSPLGDSSALALEAALVTFAATAVAAAVAVVTARLLVHHVDPLPQYAPGTTLIVPWWYLALAIAAATAAAATCGAIAATVAARSNVQEALRVA